MTYTNGNMKKNVPAAARLREMLADSSKIITCPGVYDGLTARIALSAGHECLYMTGAGTTVSRLGLPGMMSSYPSLHDKYLMNISI